MLNRWLAIAALVAVAGCAEGPYDPDRAAMGVQMMGLGLGMMSQQPARVYPVQSTCGWMGPEWRCNSW